MVQLVRSVRAPPMPGTRRPCAANGGTTGMHHIATLERIRPRIVVEGAICFTVHASTGNCGHKAAAEGGVSNFTRAGVKGGELPPGHEPPKVRLGESAVLGRLGDGLTFQCGRRELRRLGQAV